MDAVLVIASFCSIVSGLIHIVCVILLRNRLFDLESMIIWKWSEAPWWTKRAPDEDFMIHLANLIHNLECQRPTDSERPCQSGWTLNEKAASVPGAGSHLK